MMEALVERIAAEVMDSLKMADTELRVAKRYARRTVNKILTYCNRDDFPEILEDTAAQIAEDMLRSDLVKPAEKEVAGITRGDTSISYKDNSSARQQTVDFMRNYEKTLNRYKKINLPKDEKDE